MNKKEVAKLRKYYIEMVTSPKFSFPHKTRTEAEIDWLVFSIAIEGAIGYE
jgi:hypothetical protein